MRRPLVYRTLDVLGERELVRAAGTVGALTPDRGRTRVRVGPVVAEVASAEGLERGARAYASFAPRSARVIS